MEQSSRLILRHLKTSQLNSLMVSHKPERLCMISKTCFGTKIKDNETNFDRSYSTVCQRALYPLENQILRQEKLRLSSPYSILCSNNKLTGNDLFHRNTAQSKFNAQRLHYMDKSYSRLDRHRICNVNKYQIGQLNPLRNASVSPRAIVEACPSSTQPYLRLMRLDRPIGTWLLYVPCLWSLSLASGSFIPDPYFFGLFGAGAVLMRGSGCIINDMWDKDFDAKVARTKTRPLACGEVNQLQALTLLASTLSVSLAILCQFNWYSIFLGASSMGLVISYPLMKRITYWPQLFLGLTFNWGALLGWSVVAGSVQWQAALPLYAGGIAWTLMYDTIYAHQDKEDDILIGVKSSALRLGEQTKPALAGFSAVMVTCLAATGLVLEQTIPYYLGVGYVAGHLARQIYTVDLNDPDDCFRKFCSNRNMGLVFWGFILAGNYMKKKN